MGMSDQYISEGLKRFIKEKIQTVLRLEVLLLLRHHEPRAFTASELANELGVENETTAEELTELEAGGFLVQSKTREFKYHPLNETLASMIDQLAFRYANQRIAILSVMFSEHPDRARLFAEAFRIIRNTEMRTTKKNTSTKV